MRRFCLLALVLISTQINAAPRNDKNTLTNTRYVESAAETAAREFKEAELALPAVPATDSGEWFDLYINNTFTKKPKILLDSIAFAPDRTVRYILNTQSARGHDNLSAEGIFCAENSLSLNANSRSTYKIFGYADTVNKRWITPRNAEWKPIGAILNSADPIRGVLYRAFCVDGLPDNDAALQQRVRERSGRYNGKIGS